ncbi:MAG: hypothetical protein CME60_12060 [Halobacteriovoraceae bacterium]|nr:hypothetical protein [Halobacteriovoraceae bacterium]
MLNKIIFFVLILFSSSYSFGFVENVTKGYPNCMACHVSASGGGVLNDYGRSLSKELMSTWTLFSHFEDPYYGLAKNTPNIKFGGQHRVIQIHGENDQVKLKRQFTMQNNVEFAIQYAQAFVVATLGTKEGPDNTPDKRKFLSERHYIQWAAAPDVQVRVGKFRQNFGINHPNHSRFTKSSTGFGSYSESYNLDLTKFFEWGEINVSSSVGNMWTNKNEDDEKRNLAVNLTHYMGGNSRVGISLLKGESKSYIRDLFSAHAVFPLFKNIVGRSEIVYENKANKTGDSLTPKTKALYGDHQYGYKLFKGFMPYLVFEHSQNNLENSDTLILAPGTGFQFLPIPHVELRAEFQKRKYMNDPNNLEDRLSFQMHLYH